MRAHRSLELLSFSSSNGSYPQQRTAGYDESWHEKEKPKQEAPGRYVKETLSHIIVVERCQEDEHQKEKTNKTDNYKDNRNV